MSYSAVTQPRALPSRNLGTPGSQKAVQRTRVRPWQIRTEPGARSVKPLVIFVGRNWSALRESWRAIIRLQQKIQIWLRNE